MLRQVIRSSRVNGASLTTLCGLKTTHRRNSGRTRTRSPSAGRKYRSRNSSGSSSSAAASYSPAPAASRLSRCTSVANSFTGNSRPSFRSRSWIRIATVYASGPAAQPADQARTSSPSPFDSRIGSRCSPSVAHTCGSRKNSVTPISRSWYRRDSSSGSRSSRRT